MSKKSAAYKICSVCGKRCLYFYSYDIFGCVPCDRWNEKPCGCAPEDKCPFCPAPEKPSLSDMKTEEI